MAFFSKAPNPLNLQGGYGSKLLTPRSQMSFQDALHAGPNGAKPAQFPVQPSCVSIDPITLVIDECMVLSLAMRKMNRWSQFGVAAILSGGDLFSDDDLGVSPSLIALGAAPRSSGNSPSGVTSNPLHSSFLQLRAILTESKLIDALDSLTILQPFLLAIESSSTSGNVTALALNSITKFLNYGVIGWHLKNLQSSLIQITSSLTHCRFEAADQGSDDSVLLKVLRLLESIVDSSFSNLLPNAVVSEVVQTCLSLACNKRRLEVLRRAAEMSMVSMTIRVFMRLRELTPESVNIDDYPPNYSGSQLPADDLGGTHAQDSITLTGQDIDAESAVLDEQPETVQLSSILHNREASTTDENEPQFDIVCIKDFFSILISMISPSNQYQHMESTRVFALSLINIAIEIAGEEIPKHPALMSLVADPVSKDVLRIITVSDSPPLLQGSLRLFSTMAVVLGDNIRSQIELTFSLLFNSILPSSSEKDNTFKGNKTAISTRIASSKEMIIESLSLLWTRSPQFFSRLFVEYDCDFERFNMAGSFVHFLCKLALPEAALQSTDNVPPMCLEGILSLIAGINERIRVLKSNNITLPKEKHHLLADKEKKTSFVKCTELFSESPKKGVAELAERKFIKDPKDDKELADFLFHKSSRLNKRVLGEFLANPSRYNLLREFISFFEFGGLRVDEALRLLLKAFRLPGEAQQIERIVELFAETYVECQKTYVPEHVNEDEDLKSVNPDRDAVFVLSYSIILLNTDLHNPQVKKQMDLDAYKRNLRGVNNGKDFPEWYLSKIYTSIRDREIIMPEEHHGTDKWFDDIWHNLISSQNKAALKKDVVFEDLDAATVSQFDRLLFDDIVDEVIDTLIKVFNEASDDNVITKLMSSIDKCANICIYYGLTDPVNKLITQLTELSHLKEKEYPIFNQDENVRQTIPITQLTVEEKKETINVSDTAVHFGRDFKAQLAMVVLFRLIKKPDCKVTQSWDGVIKIILTLFENCLINPNIFSEFQKKVGLQPLAKVKPRYIIQRMKPSKESGLLSTFSSFLKGYSDEPPEPTEQEIELTLSTLDCVKSVNVSGIFDTISTSSTEELKLFIDMLLENTPVFSEEKKRYFESEIVFLFEMCACFSLIVNEKPVTNKLINKLIEVLNGSVTKKTHMRLSTYFFLLVRQSDKTFEEELIKTIEKINTFDKEALSKHGSSLIKPLFSLVDDESNFKHLIGKVAFWNFFKLAGSVSEFAEEVLTFVGGVITNTPDEINEQNFVSILGLLDEISSLGAIGAQLEQSKEISGEKTRNVNDKGEAEKAKALINLSKRSIEYTGELGQIKGKLSYPLIQALAHQCFNPCREVRSHAIKILQKTLLSGTCDENFKASGVYEYGLFPLLTELEKDDVVLTDARGFTRTHLDILNLVSKVFLQYQSELDTEEKKKVWGGIVKHFVTINKMNAHGDKNVVKESSSELMKNMILVLNNDFFTQENQEIWDGTWNSLDEVYPGLKDEVVGK